MKDLGQMHYFLGLEVWQQKGGIFLGQGRYTTKILKRFKMQDYRPMATPMITNWKKIDASEDKEVDPTLYKKLIRSLMYLVNTRLDICYAVNTLSQFMVEPKRAHWATTKHVLRYIRGIVEHGLMYTQGNDIRLSGFTNPSWNGSSVDRKSTTRRRMKATNILYDNQSCIKLYENPDFHDRSKHIDIKCYFITDCVQQGAVQLRYTPTGEQVAGILTKEEQSFFYFEEKMGMIKNLFQEKKRIV
eukprot:PITA_16433